MEDEEAFHLACNLAKETKGKVHALYVIEVDRALPLDAEIPEESSRGEEILANIESLARESKCPLDAEILQCRQAGPAIVQESVSKQANLIVLGIPYKRNPKGAHLGDTTTYILQNAICPVLIWHNGTAEQPSFVRS